MNRCVVCGEKTGERVCSCGCVTVAEDHEGGSAGGVSIGEGGTPLVESGLTEDYGNELDRLFVKDEAVNPTGTVHDRAASNAFSALSEEDVDWVELASTGDLAVSAAAYGARADVDVHAYVPSRTRFDVKSMVNVHGGEMTVVRGRHEDAVDALGDGEGTWGSSSADRIAGYASVAEGIEETADHGLDHVVVPVGTGEMLAGVLSTVSGAMVHAAQPAGCSPFVDSVEDGGYVACERPDTVVGECEVSRPAEELVETAVEASDMGDLDVHAVEDGDALDACLSAAREDGVDLSPAGGVALAAAEALSGTAVVVNPAAGRLSADALRNRLVYHGE